MATSYKIDLMPTTYTKSGHWLYERAHRYAYVRGVNNTGSHGSLNEAIDFLLAQHSTATPISYYQTDPTLPLQRLTAQKTGPTDVQVLLEYFRRPWSLNPIPGFPGARFRGATIATTWYRTPGQFDLQGRPTGPLTFPMGGDVTTESPPPRSWEWERPAIAMHVPFNFDFNPIGFVADRLGMTNNAPVGFGGYTFPTNSILFRSITIDVEGATILGGSQVRYIGSYDFLTVKGGFVFQTVVFDPSMGPPTWITFFNGSDFQPLYPQADFIDPPFP